MFVGLLSVAWNLIKFLLFRLLPTARDLVPHCQIKILVAALWAYFMQSLSI